MKKELNKNPLFEFIDLSKLSPTDLRIIGISLGVLSLGMALAWIGMVYVTSK